MNEINNRKTLSLEVGCLTDTGRLRQHNEDSFGFYRPNDPDILYEKGEMFLVANGFGGRGFGDVASRTAIDVITKEYFNQPVTLSIEDSLTYAFQLANNRIYEMLYRSKSNSEVGTAVTCVVIQRSNVYVAHVGNGRLYQVKGFTIKQLTQDIAAAPDNQTLPEELQTGQAESALTKILGYEEDIKPDIFLLKLRPGDHLLLCTDGLYTELENREIGRIVLKYPPQEASEQLIKAANAHGGADNLSVIIIKIKGLKSLSVLKSAIQPPEINLFPQSETKPEASLSTQTIRLDAPAAEPPKERDFQLPEAPKEKPKTTPEITPEMAPDIPIETPVAYQQERPPSHETPAAPGPETPPSSYQFQKQADYQAPRGIQRRKVVLPEAKQKKVVINWPLVGFIIIGIIFASAIIFLLIKGSDFTQKLVEDSVVAPVTKKESSKQPDKITDITQQEPPEKLPEAIALNEKITSASDDTTAKAAIMLKPVRILIVNGTSSSTSKISQFNDRLLAEPFKSIEIFRKRSDLKITSHSKIIYRPPYEGDNLRVRSIAEKIRDITSREFGTKLEIIPCDISIVLGRDYNPKRVSVLNMKRFRQFTDRMPDMIVKRVEILNGSRISGIANSLKKKLDLLILDEEKTYIRIIDARNAISVNNPKTVIKCLPFENQAAQTIVRVLGLSKPGERVINADLYDVIIVLGRNFL